MASEVTREYDMQSWRSHRCLCDDVLPKLGQRFFLGGGFLEFVSGCWMALGNVNMYKSG